MTERTIRALAGVVAVCGLGIAAAAGWRLLTSPVDSAFTTGLLLVGGVGALLCVAGAVLGYRQAGSSDRDGPGPFGATASVAGLSGTATVFAVQSVPRMFRAAILLASGLALVGSGLLLVVAARADEGI